jgi:D-sedoheptulose 7-phosphate isomerase
MSKQTTTKDNPVTTEYVRSYVEKVTSVFKAIDPSTVSKVGELLSGARAEGRQVFILGNGGSAATSSHFAVDLGKGCSRNREKRFKVISLTDNVPWITALSNDITYDDVFAEQLENFAKAGDIVIAISGSGNSKNVLKALELANRVGCETVGISGFKGGKLKELVRHHIHIPADHMGRIEDGQMLVVHILVYGFMDIEGCG